MYPSNDLYSRYKKFLYSRRTLFDTTVKTTHNRVNIASNICSERRSFLDIGAGNGNNSLALSLIFQNGIMVEIEDEPMLKTLVELRKNITWYNDLFENYKTENKFDFILLADIFEHIPDIKKFITKINNLQNIGGVLYIMTPNPFACGPAVEASIYHTKHRYGHIYHYSKEEIIYLLKDYGYYLLDYGYEENFIRRKLKNIVKGINRRDGWYNEYYLYKKIRVLIFPVICTVNDLIGYISDLSEKVLRKNYTESITQTLTFKKLK